MSNGKNPLMLMMALTMPGAANALGLADIHIDSALNERLAAEIDIVGATAAELSDLRAAVANRDTFLRYGADRPGFLASATFKVTQDSQGRPVLAVRSSEAFTEPMINFLVDLRWRNGELVRQYTLLLDPPGFAAADSHPKTPTAPEMPAAPSVATPVVETKPQTLARHIDSPSDQSASTGAERSARKTTHVKVGAKATLRGVAWRVGERSEPDLQRMMLAIFRANPNAFSGNINRLHLGAVLTIPSYAEVEAISTAEAKREIHAQMAAWHPSLRALQASAAAPVTSIRATSNIAPVVAPDVAPVAAPKTAETTALDSRVQSLEHELNDMKGLLASQHDQLVGLERQESVAEKELLTVVQPPLQEQPSVDAQPSTAAQTLPSAVAEATSVSQPVQKTLVPILGGTGLLAGALAALYFRLRRRSAKVDDDRADAVAATCETLADSTAEKALDVTAETATKAKAAEREYVREQLQQRETAITDDDTQQTAAAGYDEATHPLLPVMATRGIMPKRVNHAAATITVDDPGETTVNLRAETVNTRADSARIDVTRVDATRLDYNLVDLDMTAQHVHMPSVLNEQVVAKERRTNLADVLKMAIEREPDRHDLRMKLLELYYSAAATNRQAFLEVVQKFARDRDYLQADQWDKIAFMGRQIASENPLFADRETAVDDDLADCA